MSKTQEFTKPAKKEKKNPGTSQYRQWRRGGNGGGTLEVE